MYPGLRQSFGRYVALDSVLHRLDPLVKLGLFSVLLASIFLSGCWLHLSWVAAYLVLLAVVSKVRLSFYLSSLKYFSWMFALSFAINVAFPKSSGTPRFSLEATNTAGIFSVRLALMILAATVLTVVTCPSEIGDAILVFARIRGKAGRRAAELAALLSISLRFVPVMFEEAERIRAAQILRGLGMGGFKGRVRFAVGLVVPLLDSSLRRAAALGYALEARCYGYSIPKSAGLRLGASEVIMGASSLLLLSCLLILR